MHGQGRTVAPLVALVLFTSCRTRATSTAEVAAPTPSSPVQPATSERVRALPAKFPDNLDDGALLRMYTSDYGFFFTAFYEENRADGLLLFDDMMDHQRRPSRRHANTPLGRLERECDAHYRRFLSLAPETGATLLTLLDAAEAIPIYDFELALHLWRHARVLAPAPVTLLGRIDRHLRVVRALHLGAGVTGPVTRERPDTTGPMPRNGAVEVPAGLAAAAAAAYPGADAGRWDTHGTLLLTVVEGPVMLVRRGTEASLSSGAALELRRLDVLRAERAAILRHAVLGDLHLLTGTELTAWNVPDHLTPPQRKHVRQLVAAMRDGDRDARGIVEAMLPAVHAAIRETLAQRPVGPGENDFYRPLLAFDTGH